ncbi:hypothetical protein HPB49_004940 [Dermacentor silvarum]|uniref:Uncharacterized protein n=1 Tax=Dermacentor silvarum TaxID=543639 RepID=A0ACB8DV43_DERSI|nr:hypothetical protein HPB49_004940 [Dermacentor silvarum]
MSFSKAPPSAHFGGGATSQEGGPGRKRGVSRAVTECQRPLSLSLPLPPGRRRSKVLSWICKNGAEALSKHFFVADSLSAIQDQEYEFEKFYFLAMRGSLVRAALIGPVRDSHSPFTPPRMCRPCPECLGGAPPVGMENRWCSSVTSGA